jgi:hypothetical protein
MLVNSEMSKIVPNHFELQALGSTHEEYAFHSPCLYYVVTLVFTLKVPCTSL